MKACDCGLTHDELMAREKAQARLDVANWRVARLTPGTLPFRTAVAELAAALREARKLGLIPTETSDE